jgi:YVTN family beta-propeller protein
MTRIHEYTGFVRAPSRIRWRSPDASRPHVANTTSNTVEVYDTATRSLLAVVPVGIDPVALRAA